MVPGLGFEPRTLDYEPNMIAISKHPGIKWSYIIYLNKREKELDYWIAEDKKFFLNILRQLRPGIPNTS